MLSSIIFGKAIIRTITFKMYNVYKQSMLKTNKNDKQLSYYTIDQMNVRTKQGLKLKI